MRTVSLASFLDSATPYEQWRAEFDPNLRRLVHLSGLSLAVMLVVLQLLPSQAFLLVLKPVLMGINLVALVVYGVLLVLTHGLKQGRVTLHWVAMGQVALGALNALLFSLTIFVIVVALALGVLVALAGLAVLAAALGGRVGDV
jgi:hypothetical protein